MSRSDARAQAAALRLAAKRLERGGSITPELAEALAKDLAQHPDELDELAAVEAHEGTLPQWMVDELDRRERDEQGTEQDGDEVMDRLMARHQRRSPA